MKPLRLASLDPASRQRTIADLLRRWVTGDPFIRQQFPAGNFTAARACILERMERMERDEQIWLNHKYQVHVRQCGDNLVHLSIRRVDRQPIHDWRDLQEIKNQLLGPECEAVELYPAESRRVDSANQFHLWGQRDPKWRFPFGFDQGRLVSDDSLAGSVNRPLSKTEKTFARAERGRDAATGLDLQATARAFPLCIYCGQGGTDDAQVETRTGEINHYHVACATKGVK